MKYKAHVKVMPMREILDPQGKAVKLGLKNLGMENFADVRIGKHLDLELEAASQEEAEEQVKKACEKLLANLIMETYEFVVMPNREY